MKMKNIKWSALIAAATDGIRWMDSQWNARSAAEQDGTNKGIDMTVFVETLAIGSLEGPQVFICVRRVGAHLDIEQMPDDVEDEQQACEFAAKRWKVPKSEVQFMPVQVIPVLDERFA